MFTATRFGGNQLAIFPAAEGLSSPEMQALAKELNLSETAFVLPPNDPANSARVRIFHRTGEIPFAGHPSVGVGYMLARDKNDAASVWRMEMGSGIVEARPRRGADGVICGATISAPRPLTTGKAFAPDDVAACASLKASDVITLRHPACMASVGVEFIVAEVSPAALSRAQPDIEGFRRLADDTHSFGGGLALHLYSRVEGSVRARMFAPMSGTFEDAATGSANAALAALLLSLSSDAILTLDVSQGDEIGRPSLLRVTATRGEDGIRATVGGDCVEVLRGEVYLDPAP